MNDNAITTGDYVYIGGLIGGDFDFVNNKIGIVKKVIALSDHTTLSYVADIVLGDKIYPINFDYLYKIDEEGIDHILLSGHIVSALFKRLNIEKYSVGLDEDMQTVCYGISRENRAEILTISLLN